MVKVEYRTPDHTDFDRVLQRAIGDRVASRIAARDSTLWGPEAEPEASIRLSWTRLPESSRPLVAQITQLRDEFRALGLNHVVLCGMGGSSLAPEVICDTAGVELTVLDSSQPDMVRSVIEDRLEQTVVVVSSKSGGTVETDSQRRAYEKAFTDAGIDPLSRIVVVTDPDSPLDQQATEAGYRVFRADPHVGGRYSALTAFGLVPSGLAGADINALLESAADVDSLLYSDSPDNPALQLGVLMGVANPHRIDKLVLADLTGHGIGDWIEQLVAESTGKDGRGILPVVVPDASSYNFSPASPDSILVSVGSTEAPTAPSGYSAAISGNLGAQMLLWEVAVAVAGRLIAIDPFDQPDVESAKKAARELLGGSGSLPTPDFTENGIDVYGPGNTLENAVRALLDQLDLDHGYLAVQVYLDRQAHASFAAVRESLAKRVDRPVTFGWGPRFLHSTGQYHKGGTPNGVFLQITGTATQDLDVPGRDFTFGTFIESQAAGDASVLLDHGRPVLRLHVHDIESGLDTIAGLLA